MLIEEHELTPAHVDLGTLAEVSAMVLFGTTFCHHLTRGTGLTGIRDIRDAAGNALYPANFLTHLVVPPGRLLERFQVWDRVSVGAHVKSFGRMILESSMVLGAPGEVPPDHQAWEGCGLPLMRFGSLFIIEDKRTEPESAVPRGGHLAELEPLTALPRSVARFEEVQARGARLREHDGRLVPRAPYRHTVVPGRDLAPGHALMFATFTRLMELAERQLLLEELCPGLHAPLLDHLHVLERETYYLGNCFAGDRLRVDVRGRARAARAGLATAADRVPVAELELVFEVHQEERNTLLLVSRAHKLLLVPRTLKVARREAERFLYQYGEPSAQSPEAS